MPGTGIVPGVGAFFGNLVQALVDIDRPGRFQLIEVSPQTCTHDAAADQQYIYAFLWLAGLGATDDTQA
ncbi:hypothetical protein D3C80_2059960 [compost metagenome]